MSRIKLVLAVLVLTLASTAMADDLVQAAKKEQKRRAGLKKRSVVLTDEVLSDKSGTTQLNVIGSETSPTVAPTAAPAAAPSATPAAAGEEHQKKVQELNDKIRDLERDIKDASDKSLILQQGLVVPGNPLREFNQKADLDAARQKKADSEKALEQAKKDLAALQRGGK